MNGGQQQPQNIVTSQNREPPAYALPHLQGITGEAARMYGTGVGYQPYGGQTVAGMTPGYDMGINSGQNLAMGNLGGTPGVRAGQSLATNLINSQGLTGGHQGVLDALSAATIPAYQAISSSGGLTQGLRSTLDTSTGLGQDVNQYNRVYNDATGNENPYLLSQIAANDRRIADRVNSTMSGAGRYGSGAHTDVLARSLAEAANPVLAQDYQNRQATRLAALGGASGANQAMANIYGNAQAQGLQATQGQQGAYGMYSDILSGGLNRAGQFSQLTPALDAAQYMPAEILKGYGQELMGRDQQNINAAIQLWNQQQALPWEQLARYSGIAGGAGALGGTTTSTQPNLNQPVSGLQRGLGGALAGAGLGGSIFGPVGAGVGALGGGLLGFL